MVTLVVQTDTGTQTAANTYISEADADTYFSDRNNSTWSDLTSANKEFALVAARDYLDTDFYFIGVRDTSTQNTEWPREGAYTPRGDSIDVIPENLKFCQCELAVRASAAVLAPDITYETGGKTIIREKKKVGDIETDTHYDTNDIYNAFRSYPAAELWLKDLTVNNTQLVRG